MGGVFFSSSHLINHSTSSDEEGTLDIRIAIAGMINNKRAKRGDNGHDSNGGLSQPSRPSLERAAHNTREGRDLFLR